MCVRADVYVCALHTCVYACMCAWVCVWVCVIHMLGHDV